ncbi:MAG: hypothetical protein U0401_19835 [Anaerolineae bacterium]
MTNPINSMDDASAASQADDEMLDILRRVQSGELSVEQAEQLLNALPGKYEEAEPFRTEPDGQTFSAPLGKTANGKLIFQRGAVGLTVQGESLPGQLFKAFFEHHVPVVRVNGGTVTVRYRDFHFGFFNRSRHDDRVPFDMGGFRPDLGQRRPERGFAPERDPRRAESRFKRGFPFNFNKPQSSITLNAGIPWEIDLHGGVTHSYLDLRQIKLREISLHDGINDVELTLGEPNGIVQVNFNSGVNSVKILRPPHIPVRLTAHGGVARLTLDNQELGAVGGKIALETPNIHQATAYYAVNVSGGANNFTVTAW